MNTPVIVIIVLGAVLAVRWDGVCLHDLVRAGQVRYLPKWGWAVVCLLSCPWGGLLYVIFGRDALGKDL
ncbi:MAG: hypothetical protein ACRDPY_30235 [Streptosporangiaceae bacterium]